MKTRRLRRFPFRIPAAIAKNEAFRQEARRIFTELTAEIVASRPRRNPIAKDLRTPLFRPRIERDRKRAAKAGYCKHKGGRLYAAS